MTTPTTETEIPTDVSKSDPSIKSILRTLDAQTEQCSVATQMRLNEARARAVAATRATPFWRRAPILATAFSLSAACAFVIFTQTHTVSTSAQLEATALYEATFGADVVDIAELYPDANFNTTLDATALTQTELSQAELRETALYQANLDETMVANDLEFYAWLSKNSSSRRVSEGSGS